RRLANAGGVRWRHRHRADLPRSRHRLVAHQLDPRQRHAGDHGGGPCVCPPRPFILSSPRPPLLLGPPPPFPPPTPPPPPPPRARRGGGGARRAGFESGAGFALFLWGGGRRRSFGFFFLDGLPGPAGGGGPDHHLVFRGAPRGPIRAPPLRPGCPGPGSLRPP